MADPPARAATGANGVIVAGDGDDRGRRSGPASPDYGNQIEEACPGLAARAVHSCLDRLTAGDELVICWNRREESLRDDFRFCEGFRMPAGRDVAGQRRGSASESLQGRNPRGPDGDFGSYGDLVFAERRGRRWGRA